MAPSPAFNASAQTGNTLLAPALALDPTSGDYMIVWVDSGSSDIVYGQRATATGTLSGSRITLANAAGAKSLPRIAYESWRSKFMVIWVDNRNATQNIYGQYVSIDGTMLGGNFWVSTGPTSQACGALAMDPINQRGMVTYQDSANSGDIFGQLVK